MNRFQILVVPLAIVMWLFTTLMYTAYVKDSYTLLCKLKLDTAINYAVDAGAEELKSTSPDLDMDYTERKKITVDPQVALDAYAIAFCKNFDMLTSETNLVEVKTRYTPVFCVAAYDGYYIAQPTIFNTSGGYDSIFSIKYPYTAEKNGIRYAFDLDMENAYAFNGSTLYVESSPPFTQDEISEAINLKVTEAFMSTVYKQQESIINGYFYLPWSMTNVARTNPIADVSVLSYVANVEVGFGESIDSYAIGGARLERSIFYACYERSGEKYYAYADRIPSGVTAEFVVATQEEAASEGYKYDLAYID